MLQPIRDSYRELPPTHDPLEREIDNQALLDRLDELETRIKRSRGYSRDEKRLLLAKVKEVRSETLSQIG